MKSYTLELPNEKSRTYRYVTLFILVVNAVVFSFFLINSNDARLKDLSFFGASLSILSLILYILNAYTKYLTSHRPEISFIIISIVWILIGKYLVGLCILCFAIIGFYTRKNFEIIFSDDKIIYPSFPKKIFLWKDVANVILKDNMLTIDLKNNKLIQSVITKDSEAKIDETAFNSFCRLHLDNG